MLEKFFLACGQECPHHTHHFNLCSLGNSQTSVMGTRETGPWQVPKLVSCCPLWDDFQFCYTCPTWVREVFTTLQVAASNPSSAGRSSLGTALGTCEEVSPGLCSAAWWCWHSCILSRQIAFAADSSNSSGFFCVPWPWWDWFPQHSGMSSVVGLDSQSRADFCWGCCWWAMMVWNDKGNSGFSLVTSAGRNWSLMFISHSF